MKLRARALFRPHRVEQELHDELAFHVERETKKLIDEGLAPAEARAEGAGALRIGERWPPTNAATSAGPRSSTTPSATSSTPCAPSGARRLPALTIVVTVAIGLGVVAVLFTILNMFLFRVDAVPDISEMYAVERPRQANGDRSLFTRPRFEALRTETSVFTDAYAALPDIDLRVDGRMMAVTLVSGNFFQVVGVEAVMGRALGSAG